MNSRVPTQCVRSDAPSIFRSEVIRVHTGKRRTLLLCTSAVVAAVVAVLTTIGLSTPSYAQSAVLPQCYTQGKEQVCINPHLAWSIFNKDMPEIDRVWFPDGGTSSNIWMAPAGAMALAGGLQTLRDRLGFKGTDSIKDPFMKSFVQLWRDRTPRGQARLMEAVAKEMGTNPSFGDLDQFDEGFAKQDYTKFFKKIAPHFLAPGASFNYYSSLEDPLVGPGTSSGTPIQPLKIHGLFRRGYILSLNLGHYVRFDENSPETLYLGRWAGHCVLLVGIIYPENGPWRFIVADPERPQRLRQLTVNSISLTQDVARLFVYRTHSPSGDQEFRWLDAVEPNFSSLPYVDKHNVKKFWKDKEDSEWYDIIDSAVGFRVHLPS
jgi:hypothetical protein